MTISSNAKITLSHSEWDRQPTSDITGSAVYESMSRPTCNARETQTNVNGVTVAQDSVPQAHDSSPKEHESTCGNAFSRHLAGCLNNVGVLLHQVRDHEGAMGYYREAVRARLTATNKVTDAERRHAEEAAAWRCNEVLQEHGRLRHALADRLSVLQQEERSGSLELNMFDFQGFGDDCADELVRLSDPMCSKTSVGGGDDEENEENDDRLPAAISLYNMGLLYHTLGHAEKALSLFEMTLSIIPEYDKGDESTNDPNSVDGRLLAATTHNNVGEICYIMGRLDEALCSYVSAIESLKEGTSPHDDMLQPSLRNIRCISSALTGIGRVHYRRGEYDAAQEACSENIRLTAEVRGDDHLDVAVSLYNIGLIHHERGETDLAVKCCECFLQKALFVLSQAYHHSPVIASATHALGVMHLRNDNLQNASAALSEALRMRRCLSGVDARSKAADTLEKLGDVCVLQERFHDAIDYYGEALQVKRELSLSSQRHARDAIHILCSIGQIHRMMGDYDLTRFFYSEAVGCSENLVEGRQEVVAWLLVSVGKLHLEQDDVDEAIRMFSEARNLSSEPRVNELDLDAVLSILTSAKDTSLQHAAAA